MPGIVWHKHHVEHAVVRRAVVAGDAGAVEREHDRQAVQADVEVGLVEGAGEERRVQRDDRAQPAHRHARRHRDRVLLGDADVEVAIGELLLERQQTGRPRHGRGDRHDLRVPARPRR